MKRLGYVSKILSDFIRDISSLGGALFCGLYVLIFLIFGYYGFALKLLLGLIIMQILAIIIRSFYFKNRPNPEKYVDFFGRIDASSFPSLHAARSSFLMMMLISFFSNNFLDSLLVLLGIVVPLTRIVLRKHDWIDVVSGFILGLAVAGGFLYFFEQSSIIFINTHKPL